MKKYVCFLFALILVSFSSCSCVNRQPLPEGMWVCDELQAYLIQTEKGQYSGTIGENQKTFQMKITVYGNECAFLSR